MKGVHDSGQVSSAFSSCMKSFPSMGIKIIYHNSLSCILNHLSPCSGSEGGPLCCVFLCSHRALYDVTHIIGSVNYPLDNMTGTLGASSVSRFIADFCR